MVFPPVNFPFSYSVEEFNSYINIGLEEGYCDSTYLGKIEIPVELEELDEDNRFFGTHIREVIKLFKSFKKKKKKLDILDSHTESPDSTTLKNDTSNRLGHFTQQGHTQEIKN